MSVIKQNDPTTGTLQIHDDQLYVKRSLSIEMETFRKLLVAASEEHRCISAIVNDAVKAYL